MLKYAITFEEINCKIGEFDEFQKWVKFSSLTFEFAFFLNHDKLMEGRYSLALSLISS